MDIKKDWLSPKELLEDFGVTITTQNRLRMEKKIPYAKIGKIVRYNRIKINGWFESHSIVA
ncbi:MAG: DNA-binding protein [Sulfurimonas sp.]|jgi:hypothetical protein